MHSESQWRIPSTTHEAVDWTIASWVELTTPLAGMGREALEQPGAVGVWSLRDLLAHLAAAHRWISGQLELLLNGGTPDPMRLHDQTDLPANPHALGDQDARNAWEQTHRADWTLEQVQAEGAEMFARFIAAMARVDDGDWSRDLIMVVDGLKTHLVWADAQRVARGDDATGPMIVPFWRMVCGYAWHHYPHHLDDVQQAASR